MTFRHVAVEYANGAVEQFDITPAEHFQLIDAFCHGRTGTFQVHSAGDNGVANIALTAVRSIA